MFGSNTVQSSWANPQQNPQQTQGSAFGQPSAFGSGAFGSTNAFGQQQQPAANPMFGNLGTSNPGTSAFGAFGQNAAASTGNSAFGAPKPASGFGAFGGGTSSFGGGASAFGGTAATGTSGNNVFGPTAPSTGGAFNTGSSLFAQPKPATTFGATPASSTDANPPPVTTGTSTPTYSAFSEKDPSNPSTILQYQTITATPAYRGTSVEELRSQDYQQNRKTAGAFGQTSFGTPATQAPSLFGAPTTTQQPTTGSIFGGATTGSFATNTTQPATGAFGTFGQQQPTAGTSTGTAFPTGSAFAQPQQQQTSAFGAFGQPQQQPATGTSTGIFSGPSAFGQPKPATGFTSTFGQPTGGSAFGGTGTTNAFGQPATQPTTGANIFGQPQQQPQPTATAFGATNAAKPSIFGQPSQSAGTTTGFGTGLFGGQQQAQPTQPATGVFGTTPSTGASLFGQPQQQQQQQSAQQTSGLFSNTTQPSGGMFGSGTSGGLFGGTQANQTQQPGQTSLFGAPKPPTTGTGLFGGSSFGQPSTNTGTGTQPTLFGQPPGQQTMAQPTMGTGTGAFGGSLFGQQKPVAPTISTTPSTGGLGTSLLFGASTLGSSTAAPGGPGTLTASIAEPISSNLPIFSMLPPGPRAVPIDQQQKKKPGFFVDAPARSPVPCLPINYTPASSKLRGFGAPASSSVLGVPGQNLSLNHGKAGPLYPSRAEAPENILGRSASPALGSGGRQSVKKLVLDKKVEASDLFSRAGSPGLRGSPAKVTFSPALSQAAREKDVAREKEAATQSPEKTGQPTQPLPRNMTGRFAAHSSLTLGQPSIAANGTEVTSTSPPLQHGDYWVKPDLAKLKTYGYEELSSFKDLVVGRVGYGEIYFLEPVDLTGLPKLGALLGELVRFDDKECSVYPDGDEADKPAPGTGLNVKARITLLRCWATDKATREPIKNEQVPTAVKHLKRLKSMKETHFESFDTKEGEWTFTVNHF